MRPEMERTVPQVIEEMIEAKKLDGVSGRYIEDLRHRRETQSGGRSGDIAHFFQSERRLSTSFS